jgi:hypothetical protein
MEAARVGVGMDKGNGLAYPTGPELADELLGKARHPIPLIGPVHKDPAIPLPPKTVIHPRKVMLGSDSLLRNF